MLGRLTYAVTFPSTGRRLGADVRFDRGLTLITGPNEAGKSLILEMVRFALFGAAALRAKAEDYSNISCTLDFFLDGRALRVERTLRKALLIEQPREPISHPEDPKRNCTQIAVSVTPVNEAIVRLLGFGLSVFDIACSVNQGEIERLSAMSAAERRRLVDSVIGISALERVAKWAGEEALLREREATGLAAGAAQPETPERPTYYARSAEIEPLLDEARNALAQVAGLHAWLAHEQVEPLAPTPSLLASAGELAAAFGAQKARRAALLAERAQTTRARGLITAAPGDEAALAHARNHLTAWSAYQDARDTLQRTPRPDQPLSVLIEMEKAWDVLDLIDQRVTLQHSIERHHEGEIECPACDHRWSPDAGSAAHLAKVEAELATLDQALAGVAYPDTPTLTRTQIARVRQAWDAFAPHAEAVINAELIAATEVEPCPHTFKSLGAWERALAEMDKAAMLDTRLAAIEAELAADVNVEDLAGMLAERRADDASQARFAREMESFVAWLGECAVKRARLEELEPIAAAEPELARRHHEARIYEAAFVQYKKALAVYDKAKAHIAALEAEAREHRGAQKAMNALRGTVKGTRPVKAALARVG